MKKKKMKVEVEKTNKNKEKKTHILSIIIISPYLPNHFLCLIYNDDQKIFVLETTMSRSSMVIEMGENGYVFHILL